MQFIGNIIDINRVSIKYKIARDERDLKNHIESQKLLKIKCNTLKNICVTVHY